MDDDDSKPGRSTRFKPRQSGNRNGRPRKSNKGQSDSPFEELRNRTITVQMDGVDRELTLAEALLHKTFQQALAGGRMAIRTILKRIQVHEATKAPTRRHFPKIVIHHPKPRSADEAALILGIASKVPNTFREDGGAHLVLEPWAAASGLARARGLRLSNKEIRKLKGQTRDPESVAWPPGAEE